jgi:hypothetical protein
LLVPFSMEQIYFSQVSKARALGNCSKPCSKGMRALCLIRSIHIQFLRVATRIWIDGANISRHSNYTPSLWSYHLKDAAHFKELGTEHSVVNCRFLFSHLKNPFAWMNGRRDGLADGIGTQRRFHGLHQQMCGTSLFVMQWYVKSKRNVFIRLYVSTCCSLHYGPYCEVIITEYSFFGQWII